MVTVAEKHSSRLLSTSLILLSFGEVSVYKNPSYFKKINQYFLKTKKKELYEARNCVRHGVKKGLECQRECIIPDFTSPL